MPGTPEAQRRGRGWGCRRVGGGRPQADPAAAPFSWASHAAHRWRGAGLGFYFLFHVSLEITATPHSSPEKINTPVIKLIPKRRVFFEMGPFWGLICSRWKAQPWGFFFGEQIGDGREKEVTFQAKRELGWVTRG